ncbi:uncharacterized protein DUF262 [Asanoa ferruginea]|uniref:Uncharacterized protein DUF262 n=1 Tax=Asanoa ferruginea TaxID=53367 RepID=A0A3D9ZLY5_9ACTN|nr:DUF262 domain-containing protein [Asanoa ferruginea]REF98396.1 uncharacterized protein DUF262 [Asanoa ferruginea]GIF51225.1 hypothetical protein Afe04nite_57640 [Asanoa ferruginea]
MPRNRSPKPLVDACGYSISDLFKLGTFHLDYFQRDYVWEEPQVKKLINDLADKFLDQWEPTHTARDVGYYDPYFLGPIIVYYIDKDCYLADGQQRVVTLLLSLIYLRRLVDEPDGPTELGSRLASLIYTEMFGRKTFAVAVDRYADCFDALLHGREYNADGEPPYVQRVLEAYQHIEKHYPERLRDESLVLFVEWLLHRVSLVALSAVDQDRAIEMFQSMNDRGVHLSPMDHLKRYLLGDSEDPQRSDAQWQSMVSDLEAVERGAAFRYVREVFRARYFDPANEGGPSLENATHEWVLAHENDIWPNYKNGDRSSFVTDLLLPLKNTYVRLLRGQARVIRGLEAVRYNAWNGITGQFALTLAAARPEDSKPAGERKARLIAEFIDLFVVTRAVRNDPCDQKAVDGLVDDLLPAVRLCHTEAELREVLAAEATGWTDHLENIVDLRFHNNGPFIHYLLARLTAWLEVGAEREDPTDRMLRRPVGDRGFEIEHLLTSTESKYAHVQPDALRYGLLRSRLGALVLLDGPENSSYGGARLAVKVPLYRNDTLLAATLNAGFLEEKGRVRLRRFVKQQGLTGAFPPYEDDQKLVDLVEARAKLYRLMAERIWDPARLGLTLQGAREQRSKPGGSKRTRRNHGVHLADLVGAGLVRAGDRLEGQRKGRTHLAEVLDGARIRTASGAVFPTLSAAAMDALDLSAANGWTFWQLTRTGQRMDAVRARFLGS